MFDLTRTLLALMDSVQLINSLVKSKKIDDTSLEVLVRNYRHLKKTLAKPEVKDSGHSLETYEICLVNTTEFLTEYCPKALS
jgi:hypothetical protein